MYYISTSKVTKVWEDVIEKCMNGDLNRIWPKHVHNLKFSMLSFLLLIRKALECVDM